MLLGLMTCKEAAARLDDYVDRELSARELQLVERHLKICHECAKKFAFEAGLINGLRQKVSQLEVPPQMVANIKALLEAEAKKG